MTWKPMLLNPINPEVIDIKIKMAQLQAAQGKKVEVKLPEIEELFNMLDMKFQIKK